MRKYKNINDTFDYDNIVFEDFSKIKEVSSCKKPLNKISDPSFSNST